MDPAPSPWGAPAMFRACAGDDAQSSSAWMPLATGLLTAGALAYALCGLLSREHLPLAHPSLLWGIALLRAFIVLALTAAAGALDVWLVWHVLSAKPMLRPALLSRHALVGWVFLPALVLLEREQSLWLLPVGALAAMALAASLRGVFPRTQAAPNDATSHREMQALYGLPQETTRTAPNFFIAACAQTSLLLACAGALTLAGVVLMAGVAALVWSWNPPATIPWAIPRRRSLAGMLILALLVTMLAQLPWIDARLSLVSGESLRTRSKTPALANKYDTNYVGIVLWPPPPKKHAEIHAPVPHSSALRAGALAQPLVIPFDGAYWYFQAPRNGPGAQAHVAHGKPTDAGINPRSTNESALLMEAHQTLVSAIDPACCREIDVTLTNADRLSGRINLGVRLSDSTAKKQAQLLVGVKEIPSSDAGPTPTNRPPVQEVLRFPMAQSRGLRRFDRITVFFLREHWSRGAKVAILSFALIPR